MRTNRLRLISIALVVCMFAGATHLAMRATIAAEPPEKPTLKEYLKKSAVTRETIDRFLRGPSWGQFDPELGYILGNYFPADGIDQSATISTVQANGARTSFMYAGRKCRINTYGDSFTLCEQVNDGETWQEYLAAHLGEPIRNFGMGGYGVYQAYRRMLREEKTDHAAENLIFYIWGDDHIRSLLRFRHAIIYQWRDPHEGRRLQGNFWSNVELDLETGLFVEKENQLPTPEALYHMTEPQWMADHLQDDLALQLFAFKEGRCRDLDRDQVRSFAATNKKKLMVVLFDPGRTMAELKQGNARYDQEIVDYLTKEKVNYFDMNEVHLRDFRKYNLSFEEYKKQYLIGHYNPAGNHFFAHSIKDKVVDWLAPKPITYQKRDPQTIEFKDYLQGPLLKPTMAKP